MTLDRSLTVLGAVSVMIGLSTMAYTHLSIKPDLERSVDVARRLIDDAIFGAAALAQLAEATDAVRGPAADVTTRSVAMLDPGIALMEALDASLRAAPGVGQGRAGIVGRLAGKALLDQEDADELRASIAQLRRAIEDTIAEASRLRIAARTLDTATRRHTLPSFQPVLAHLADRLRETQAILTDSDPARGALLADLIAGIYLVLGAALMLLARALKVSAPGAAT